MKHMKKLIVAALAVVTAVALCVPAVAFAADITVTNVKKGETYEAFKLLEFTSSDTNSDGTPDAYSYYLETSNAKTATLKPILVSAGFEFEASADGTQYVLTNAEALKTAGADALVAALKSAGLTSGNALAYASKTADDDGEAVFSNLATGYWFVTTTTGSLCALASYDDEALIVDKHEDTTVAKTATESSTNVGDTVHFTVTVNAKKGEKVTLNDELSNGLQLCAQSDLAVTGITGYDVKDWITTANASKYQIEFPEVTADTEITVTYTATVTAAAIQLDKVSNTATASWGDAQTVETTSTIKLFGFDISKVDASDNTKKLDGVKFTLTKTVGNTTYYYDGSSVWTTAETKLTTANGGAISVKGIAAGTYTLTETDTLDGYNKLGGPITVTIAADGSVTYSGAAELSGSTITIQNKKGAVLPSTGGMGTTILYIVGGIMVVAAGAYLVIRRRASKAHESEDVM